MKRLVKCHNCGRKIEAEGNPGDSIIMRCPDCGSRGRVVFPKIEQRTEPSPIKIDIPSISKIQGDIFSNVSQATINRLSILKAQIAQKKKRKLNWDEFFNIFYRLKNKSLFQKKNEISNKKNRDVSWNEFFTGSIKKHEVKKRFISIGYMIGVFIIVTMVLLFPLILLGLGENIILLIPVLIVIGGIFAFISVFLIVPFSVRKRYRKFINLPSFLSQTANDFSKQYGLKRKVRFFYCETPEINAMTYSSLIGHNICVTSGLLNAYKNGDISVEEFRSIVGHEFGHIVNNDVFRGSFVNSWSSIFKMIGSYIMMMGMGFAGIGLVVGIASREKGSGIAMAIAGYIMIISGAIMRLIAKIADIIAFDYQRRQEYNADLVGAKLTTSTSMARALDKIEKLDKRYQAKKLAALPYSERWTIEPNNVSFFDKLFSTHPPMNKRISRLMEIGKYS